MHIRSSCDREGAKVHDEIAHVRKTQSPMLREAREKTRNPGNPSVALGAGVREERNPPHWCAPAWPGKVSGAGVVELIEADDDIGCRP